jgi:hypothetical protein
MPSIGTRDGWPRCGTVYRAVGLAGCRGTQHPRSDGVCGGVRTSIGKAFLRCRMGGHHRLGRIPSSHGCAIGGSPRVSSERWISGTPSRLEPESSILNEPDVALAATTIDEQSNSSLQLSKACQFNRCLVPCLRRESKLWHKAWPSQLKLQALGGRESFVKGVAPS